MFKSSKTLTFLSIIFLSFFVFQSTAQNKKTIAKNLVYVDKQGVLRYTKDKTEAAFFGVNYTVPFAYGYRSVKRTGIDLEKAIDQDVYHFARLGLDAFRVHVWDWEITDSLGNLLENEHLRLFDYLLHKLKERKIKILITPIAFWGNGYPEKDEKTRSFSDVYGKGPAVVTEGAIKAQENYLKQFFNHNNPYTKLTYKDDPDVIATEINNEPHHSGPKGKTTEYVNRLAAAVRATGWSKPVFYNISESPTYSDAIVKANVDGHSFQWYPSGLVANHTLQGNFLPHIDTYHIPFDSIPAFKYRAKMVYEFDAADLLQSYLYPSMAKSLRGAGFQWATQFAYDPMATAYGNTEYQTHYLNLAYTPAKAISYMIASKAFHRLPRNKSYGTYPVDSVFDVFRVSYRESLSEMNTPTEFYYSASTSTQPVSTPQLRHVAGVGSSPIVKYNGYGAYFIDQVAPGVWRLELMPDALHIRDPFEKASPRKEVTRIQWQTNSMQVILPDLGDEFTVTALNDQNTYATTAAANAFAIAPGTYLLRSKVAGATPVHAAATIGNIGLNEFVAPKPFLTDLFVKHIPNGEISPNLPFTITATIVGIKASDKVSAEVRNSSGKWKTIQLKNTDAYQFSAVVPAEIITPGLINYRIIIEKQDKSFVVFPGNHQSDPYAWDEFENETWKTYVASGKSPVVLFNANNDRSALELYNPSWRDNSIEYVTAEKAGQLVLKATMKKAMSNQTFGWQQFIAGKLKERQSEVLSLATIVVRARVSESEPATMRIALLNKEGRSFSTLITVKNQFQDINIPLNSLKPDSTFLLPRPYPGFQPLMFLPAGTGSFNITEMERLQVMFLNNPGKAASKSFEVESILLDKSK